MKILIINSVCGIRSTGRIVTDIAEKYIFEGHECRIAYGRECVPCEYQGIAYRIGTKWSVRYNALKARVFDNEGFNAKKETKKFIEWANNYNPDIVWLHNLHGYYINIEYLFEWIKNRPNMEVKWTLHDCWAFTGHCAYFSYVQCDKWQEGCYECEQTKKYPTGILVDKSMRNYLLKKKIFNGVNKMTLIVPSKWLSKLVKQSFLSQYPTEVIYNTIDMNVFKPHESNYREKYNLQNKKVILGVASVWDERKGLLDFIELSRYLDDRYKIVLIGLTPKQKRKNRIPDTIICLPPTNSKEKLTKYYTMADIFLNLSKEETFGLTTVEALACGTYAVVYKNTACEEVVSLHGGIAVEQNVRAVLAAIHQKMDRFTNS